MGLIEKAVHGIAWRARRLYRKTVGFLYKMATLKFIYPMAYRRETAKQPLNGKKVVFLEMRMGQITDSLELIYRALEKDGSYQLRVCSIGDGLVPAAEQYKNSLAALKEMASAKYIFLDDSSALISSIRPRSGVKIIQVWHACGAFKKFGFSTAEKKFGGSYRELTRFPLHKNFTYVTVSSPEVVWAYAEAFHMEDRKQDILPIGISRTDIFFDRQAMEAAREKLHRLMPEAGDKKIILYAPTFRGRVKRAKSPKKLDILQMQQELGDAYVLLCKHHPFVKKRPKIPEECENFARDMTEQMSIEELLMVSDICISDYSSLIFEYSLYERPMIFFAYDLEDYGDWRGFYYNYEEMTPGPICRTTEEIIAYIQDIDTLFDRQRVKAFREKFMSACDGHATERVLELMS